LKFDPLIVRAVGKQVVDEIQNETFTFSSRDAAKQLGLDVSTLSRYIAAKKVPAPKALTTGGITVHIWTQRDIERVRKLLPKIKNGRKLRHKG